MMTMAFLSRLASAPNNATLVRACSTLDCLLHHYDLAYLFELMKVVFTHDIDTIEEIFSKTHETQGGLIFNRHNPPFARNMLLYVNALLQVPKNQLKTSDIILVLLKEEDAKIGVEPEQIEANLNMLTSHSDKEALHHALEQIICMRFTSRSQDDTPRAQTLQLCMSAILREQKNPDQLVNIFYSLSHAYIIPTEKLIHEIMIHPNKEQLHAVLRILAYNAQLLLSLQKNNTEIHNVDEQTHRKEWTFEHFQTCMVAMIERSKCVKGMTTITDRFINLLAQLDSIIRDEANQYLSSQMTPETKESFLEAMTLLQKVEQDGVSVIWQAIKNKVITRILRHDHVNLDQIDKFEEESVFLKLIEKYGQASSSIFLLNLEQQLCESKGYLQHHQSHRMPNTVNRFFSLSKSPDFEALQEKAARKSASNS